MSDRFKFYLEGYAEMWTYNRQLSKRWVIECPILLCTLQKEVRAVLHQLLKMATGTREYPKKKERKK